MASKREKIKMKSEESDTYYFTVKNKTHTPGRMSLRKYDSRLRRHVMFKETK